MLGNQLDASPFSPQDERILHRLRASQRPGIHQLDDLCESPFFFSFFGTRDEADLFPSLQNVSLRFFSFVRQQYGARHDGHHPTVSYSDVAFAVHASPLSLPSLDPLEAELVPLLISTGSDTLDRLVLPNALLPLLPTSLDVQQDRSSPHGPSGRVRRRSHLLRSSRTAAA